MWRKKGEGWKAEDRKIRRGDGGRVKEKEVMIDGKKMT